MISSTMQCVDNSRKATYISIGPITLFYSYETLIGLAFKNTSVRVKNEWGPTTGRHINQLNINGFKIVSADELNKVLTIAIAETGSSILKHRVTTGEI